MKFVRKLFIVYLILFFVFSLLLFPFSSWSVKLVTRKILKKRAMELIAKMEKLPGENSIVQALETNEEQRFFRTTLLDKDKKIIYDSHARKILGDRFQKGYFLKHAEIEGALRAGEGYSESFSHLLNQKFIYVALVFSTQDGRTFVLRTAFPHNQIGEVVNYFDLGFFVFGSIVLFLFCLITFLVTYYFSRPINRIIELAKTYKKRSRLPVIDAKQEVLNEDLNKLIHTLNGLSIHVQKHIDEIEQERNAKETILETLVEGIIAVDSNMVVVYINKAAGEMLDLDLEDDLGKRFPAKYEGFFDLLEMSIEQQRMVVRSGQKVDFTDYLFDIIAVPRSDARGSVLILQPTFQN